MTIFAVTSVPLTSHGARQSVALFGASPRTTAVPVLPASQYGTPEWLAERRYMIGASEMAAVLGLSPHASPFSLWWAKREGWELEQTLGMRIGHLLEPVVAGLFAELRPDLLVCRSNTSLWRHPHLAWMGCTPDYLGVRSQPEGLPTVEPIEIKTDEGGSGWGPAGSGEVPVHHRVQVRQQCVVFGADRGHLVRLAGKRLTAYVIECDTAALVEVGEWVTQGEAFVKSLMDGDPPDIDGHKATTETLERLHPGPDPDASTFVEDELAAQYEWAEGEYKAAKQVREQAKNLVRHALGDARYGAVASTGRRFVDRRVYKRRAYEVAASMVDALYPVKQRKDTPGGNS